MEQFITDLGDYARTQRETIKDLKAENQRLREALGELFCGLDEHWVTYPENISAIRKARELLEDK